ncbi:hypothetical protein ACFL1K_04275 [Candidatus Omnitrophota bacterium]
MHRHLKGQSTLEYAIVIALVVAALLAMNIYMKRAVQGRMRSATDDIGEQFDPAVSTAVTRDAHPFAETTSYDVERGGRTTSTTVQEIVDESRNLTVEGWDSGGGQGQNE